MSATFIQQPELRTQRVRPALLAIAGIAIGVAIALLWSYEFVDKVIGQNVAHALLGDDLTEGTGWIATAFLATVTGLAGTFTACNVACFASLGPLAADAKGLPTRASLVRHAAGQLLGLAAGMGAVASIYGCLAVVAGHRLPMLSDSTYLGMPGRLFQAGIVNVVLGIGLVLVAVRYLAGRPLPAGSRGTVLLGALLGLLIVGRPFPLFRSLLSDMVDQGGVFRGALLMILVVLGNLALVALLFLGSVALTGPALLRLNARRPQFMLRLGGTILMAFGAFSVFYWGFRVPVRVLFGWFQ